MEDVLQHGHRTPWSFPSPSHQSPAFFSAAIISVKSVKLSRLLALQPNTLWPRLLCSVVSWLASPGLAGPGGLDVERVDVCARPAEGPAWLRGSPSRSPGSPATSRHPILLSPSGWSGHLHLEDFQCNDSHTGAVCVMESSRAFPNLVYFESWKSKQLSIISE